MVIEKNIETRKGIFVTKPALPPFDEYLSYIKRIWDKAMLTNMGPLYEEFRERLADYLKAEICLPMCNGHMALEMTIQAMGLKGEVITTPFTFASTTHAIVRNGCTPVFCDIREEDCTIAVDKIEELITDKTVAILPVHVYGLPCDVEKIDEIAKKHGLKVIYDAAHAFGVKLGDQSVMLYGDASIISFHATKAFQTIEGGCSVLRDMDVAMRIYQLENFGIMDEEVVAAVGANAKMNEFEAAMGLCNLDHFDEIIAKRKKLYELYVSGLSGIQGVRLLKPYRDDITLNYAYMPVLFDEEIIGKNRNDIYAELSRNGVYPRKYFYPITSEYDCYKDKQYRGLTPIAKKSSRQVLTLPLYPDLPENEVIRICEIIKGACNWR